MKEPVARPFIEIVAAIREQQTVVANLLELYAHDFSGFYDVDLGPDGRFGYASLPLYWTDPNRHPFLIWVDRKLAGFALVKRGSEVTGNQNVWDLVEFFMARGFRRRGIGTSVAHELWRRHPGTWEVRVLEANVAAFPFWSRAIALFTGKPVPSIRLEKVGDSWSVFSFETA